MTVVTVEVCPSLSGSNVGDNLYIAGIELI
jgi:hypothetical protein